MYSSLPDHVNKQKKQLQIDEEGSVRKDFVESFLQRHLPKGRLQKGEDQEMKTKFMMLDNSKKKSSSDAGKKGRRKRRILSARECKNLKIFKVEKEGQKYEDYLPLHHLWLGYMKELTNYENFKPGQMNAVQQRLLKADLHGCQLTVQRSKCPSYVGVCGILLQETKNTFNLITKENKVKCIPKANSVFTFTLGTYQFTIYGNNFRVRSSERAVRKFKSKATVDL